MPKLSKSAPSEEVSLACWVSLAQPDAGRVNTYAAPWYLFAPTGAVWVPAATVLPSPEIATLSPRSSRAVPSEAVSLAASVSLAQPDAGRVNTNTVPWFSFAPTLIKGTPTATVPPSAETATDVLSR